MDNKELFFFWGIWGVRPLYLNGTSKRMQKVYASACRFQEVTRGQKSILRYLLFEWNILCTALVQNYIKQFKMHTCSLRSRAIESRVIAIASCDIIDNLLLLQSPLIRNHPRIIQAEFPLAPPCEALWTAWRFGVPCQAKDWETCQRGKVVGGWVDTRMEGVRAWLVWEVHLFEFVFIVFWWFSWPVCHF